MSIELKKGKSTKQMPLNEKMQELQTKQLLSTFEMLDEDHDGWVDSKQIIQVLEETQLDYKTEIIYELIMDLSGPNRRLNFQGFVKVMQVRMGDLRSKSGINTIFNLYDKERSGRIGLDQIMKIISDLGENIDQDEAESILGNFTQLNKCEEKTTLNFEEFYLLITHKSSIF